MQILITALDFVLDSEESFKCFSRRLVELEASVSDGFISLIGSPWIDSYAADLDIPYLRVGKGLLLVLPVNVALPKKERL